MEFTSTIEIVIIKKCQCYRSIWKITSCQLLLLYLKYLEDFQIHPVFRGTFFNLKSFNICHASKERHKNVSLLAPFVFSVGSKNIFLMDKKRKNYESIAYYHLISIMMPKDPNEQPTYIA